uniref:Restriction endonuclease n=1 Tax=Thermodesulfobacterium geofontis TaxID=1295609 RepID=A0A7C4JQV9_9BACT
MRYMWNNLIKLTSHQIIIFGPPGAGKSYFVKNLCEAYTNSKENIFTTCFHPEYKHGDFVGRLVPYTKDEKVVYKFIEGILTKALRRAYELMVDADNKEPNKVFLIIDELNRGNSSAIFGIFFNLLDRNEDGWSVYSVEVDKLLEEKIFPEGLRNRIKNSSNNKLKKLIYQEKVRIKFPPNFYIIATLNTSDESIFYMDSAFKRRWEWYYMDENNQLFPKADDKVIPFGLWNWLRQIINRILTNEEISNRIRGLDDKILGFYFVNSKNGFIRITELVNKISFHLWDSVFRQNRGLLKDFFKKLKEKLSLETKEENYALYKNVVSELYQIIYMISEIYEMKYKEIYENQKDFVKSVIDQIFSKLQNKKTKKEKEKLLNEIF